MSLLCVSREGRVVECRLFLSRSLAGSLALSFLAEVSGGSCRVWVRVSQLDDCRSHLGRCR